MFTTINVAGVLKASLVNGDGIRYVIFVQGCKHYCKGCQNPDTWNFNGGTRLKIADLAKEIKDFIESHPIDGITLSGGGDPFYQQEECVELLKMLGNVNVWAYTGFSYEEIKDTQLAKMCDVIVDGQFVEELKCEGYMYGSSNQRIIRQNKNLTKC